MRAWPGEDERNDVGVPLQVAQHAVIAHVMHGARHQAPPAAAPPSLLRYPPPRPPA